MTDDVKTCSRCGAEKSVTAFHVRSARPCGIASHCRDCDAARKKDYRAQNNALVREQGRALYASDPETRKAAHRAWRAANPDKMREAKKRCRGTVKARLETSIRGGIRRGLRKGGKLGNTFAVLGYSVDELRAHLELKFLPGMTWQNWGAAWHIDHVRPLSSFQYETTRDDGFRKAWALGNLQPLWARDNLRKGAKINWPAPANDNFALTGAVAA